MMHLIKKNNERDVMQKEGGPCSANAKGRKADAGSDKMPDVVSESAAHT
jgi:hypothetical protein